MDDTPLMGRFQRFRDLQRELQGFLDGNRPALDPLGQRVAFDQFQDERGRAVGVFEAVNGADVRVIDPLSENHVHLTRRLRRGLLLKVPVEVHRDSKLGVTEQHTDLGEFHA